MFMSHHVCIAQQDMMKTMIMMKIIMMMKKYNFIYPMHYTFCNVNVSPCLYSSTEYDEDYDNSDDQYKFAEAVQNMSVFDQFYVISTFENIEVRRHVCLTLCMSILFTGLSL